ncbi:MAG: hypothetical protein MJ201_03710 [Mycoplasmoidaceae bacterium]|nr:hypothetical protein [Mycoplasmoidaceae bacterium]
MCVDGNVSYENLFSIQATDIELAKVRESKTPRFAKVYGAEDRYEENP